MISISYDYNNYLKKYANIYQQNIDYGSNLQNRQAYNKNAGNIFELRINRLIIKSLNEFMLYWGVNIDIQTNVTWTLNSDFFENKDKLYIKEESSLFKLDHLLITPYAIFILESKNYATDSIYKSYWDEWIKIDHMQHIEMKVRNPVRQLLKYDAIIRQLLYFYEVSLPVYSRVIFNNPLDLSHIHKNEHTYILSYKELIPFIYQVKTKCKPNKEQALKLIKSLYFHKCYPIAYDNNVENWRI